MLSKEIEPKLKLIIDLVVTRISEYDGISYSEASSAFTKSLAYKSFIKDGKVTKPDNIVDEYYRENGYIVK